MINSKDKGKRGELEIVHILQENGYDAHRSAQFCGNTGDAPDVVSDFPFHIEVKHQERLEIDKWWEQASRDAKGKPPCVIFRKNHQKWKICVDLEEMLKLCAKCR